MKKQTKIYIYNIATVIFALLTVISLGSRGSLPVYNVFMNTSLYGLLTYVCADRETRLRKSMKKRNRKPQLSVYSNRSARHVA